jgi:hypothetical protein
LKSKQVLALAQAQEDEEGLADQVQEDLEVLASEAELGGRRASEVAQSKSDFRRSFFYNTCYKIY